MAHKNLVKLAELANSLEKFREGASTQMLAVLDKHQENAQLIINIGKTAHGLRHREHLAPQLIKELERFIKNELEENSKN